jgi:hypothetical protein
MTHHTPTKKNAIAAQQLARVRLELKRSKEPMRAADLAQRASVDVTTATTMLVRLRTEGLAWAAGKATNPAATGKNKASKSVTLWAWHALRPVSVAPPTYIPHLPSTQPNGSPEFWTKHMAAMNAPARMAVRGEAT